MLYEMLVGLEVINDKVYQDYRKAMMPILISYGGSFAYDFKIAEVLLSETNKAINRVFIIRFPNEKSMSDFFSDPKYLKVKAQFFQASVKSTTIIASYTQNKI